MRFGKTLRESTIPEWRDHYIDYAKLKSFLREDVEDDDQPWTEHDETRFSEEIFNVQLEKVARFQEERVAELSRDIDAALDRLRGLAPEEGAGRVDGDATRRLRELEADLDALTNGVKQLKRFSSLNYTGFLKIVKKHDRKRGGRYKVRPLMNVRLSARPFNSEQGYVPLLNKLSIMYFAIRQQLESEEPRPLDLTNAVETVEEGERYTAQKFWVHADNLLEVRTYILRRLPALVYHTHASDPDAKEEDPAVTSLYLDSPKFDLYSHKVERESKNVTSVRLRWYGRLAGTDEVFVEKKSIDENGASQEQRFTIKPKYVKRFLDGTYRMEKTIQKMDRSGGRSPEEIEAFRTKVAQIQDFILSNKLAPVLRANYVRSAFQKPGDRRVRVSIDTDVAFIREDCLDARRPCRDPGEWHRTDIDGYDMTYPFRRMNQSEVSRFPHALLEIKVRAQEGGRKAAPSWVEDLMGSHLVYKADRFSKFVHGVAALFDDHVNRLPFWLSQAEADIRKDPRQAFDEEEQRRARRAEEESAIGSFLGAGRSAPASQPHAAGKSSPIGQSFLARRMAAEASASAFTAAASGRDEEAEEQGRPRWQKNYGTISSFLPNLSLTRYGINKRKKGQHRPLPEGVEEPAEWLKNAGEVNVEPKVWLANERTYVKWQHISVLLGTLALALYASAGRDATALAMGVAYVCISVATAGWGWWVLRRRQELIRERSGKDFDFDLGPLAVSGALIAALVLNFYFRWRAAFKGPAGSNEPIGLGGDVVDDFGYSATIGTSELV